MMTLIERSLALVDELYQICREKNLTVATAESCTGGTVGALLTHPAGASRYYLGGVVSYANEVKKSLLGVKNGTLAAVGAVSEETCGEMAKGAHGGESPEKPQGLVFIGTFDGKTLTVTRHTFTGDRKTVRLKSAEAALSMLIDAARRYE